MTAAHQAFAQLMVNWVIFGVSYRYFDFGTSDEYFGIWRLLLPSLRLRRPSRRFWCTLRRSFHPFKRLFCHFRRFCSLLNGYFPLLEGYFSLLNGYFIPLFGHFSLSNGYFVRFDGYFFSLLNLEWNHPILSRLFRSKFCGEKNFTAIKSCFLQIIQEDENETVVKHFW